MTAVFPSAVVETVPGIWDIPNFHIRSNWNPKPICWALLANYMDESLLRNKTSYDLSGKMGMVYLKSTNVEVILNGVYAGNYQLVGNVRIDKSRVNIHNCEDVASDAAKAIAKKEGIKCDAKDALEDYMT